METDKKPWEEERERREKEEQAKGWIAKHCEDGQAYSKDVESQLLGTLIIFPEHWEAARDIIAPEHMYYEMHIDIFRAIGELKKEEKPVDALLIYERIRKEGRDLEELVYISELSDRAVASPTQVKAYAKIIRDHALARKILELSLNFQSEAIKEKDRLGVLERATAELARLRDEMDDDDKDMTPIAQAMQDTFAKIEKLLESKETITGVPTGFRQLDHMTAGLQPKELVILAARPSMGKSALAMSLALSAAKAGKGDAYFFSLEMPTEQLTTRILASIGEVSMQKLRTGQLKEQDIPKLTRAASQVARIPLFINDKPTQTFASMQTYVERNSRKTGNPPAMVIVDYIQLMASEGEFSSREQEIASISMGLKAMAKKLNCPVVALSQLNRTLERRTDKRPIMSDLRDSGQIEQDADVVMFIYRDEVYNEDSVDVGIAEIIIGKQRNGPCGTARVRFDGHYTKFSDIKDTI